MLLFMKDVKVYARMATSSQRLGVEKVEFDCSLESRLLNEL
jgi:hypothetical protein